MKDKEKQIVDTSWRAKMVEKGLYKDAEEKQIKEMAEQICSYSFCCKSAKDCYECEHNDMSIDASCTEIKCAKELLKHYQPKLPKDSVVLSREEYTLLLKSNINDVSEYIADELATERKETAEKFYKKVRKLLKKLTSLLTEMKDFWL